MTANRTLTAVAGIEVGHAHDPVAGTGCTAILGPFRAAVDVRGLATGTRELGVLSPLHLVPMCDGILLSGGSAFGLAAADGVVRWLDERGRGFATGAAVVPIVPAAVIYDLSVGDGRVRPDAEMGYAAAESASADPVPEGRVGCGAGATVGKLHGAASLEWGGVGNWAEGGDEGMVAALAVVNAFGDVLDAQGSIVAGARAACGGHLDTARALRTGAVPEGLAPVAGAGRNTTLAVVATEIPLDKRDLQVVARQAMNGLVRRISPCNTPFDGDVVFAVSPPARPESLSAAELLSIGLRAQAALEVAIERAVGHEDVET